MAVYPYTLERARYITFFLFFFFLAFFTGNNFCDLPFASQDNEPLRKKGPTLNRKVDASRCRGDFFILFNEL